MGSLYHLLKPMVKLSDQFCMSIGVGLDNQDMDLKVFWTERLQVKPLVTLFHCRDRLSANLEGRILSLLGKWVVDLGTSRQDFAFAE